MFRIETSVFKKIIKVLNKVIAKKSRTPIIQTVLIYTQPGTVTFIGGTLETFVKITMPINTTQYNSLCINYVLLKKVITACQEMYIDVDYKQQQLILGEKSLSTLSSDEYPEIPSIAPLSPFTISNVDLINALTCAGKAHDRRALNHIYLDNIEGNIRLVALDGYLLYLKDTECTWTPYVENFLISRECAQVVTAGIFGEPLSVNYGVANNHVMFDQSFSGDIKLAVIGRILDDAYPPYKTILPQNNPTTTIQFNPRTATQALKRLSSLATIKNPVVLIHFSGDQAILKYKDLATGNSSTELLPITGQGAGSVVGFKLDDLLRSLQATLTSNLVILEVRDDSKLVKVLWGDKKAFNVIVPLNPDVGDSFLSYEEKELCGVLTPLTLLATTATPLKNTCKAKLTTALAKITELEKEIRKLRRRIK